MAVPPEDEEQPDVPPKLHHSPPGPATTPEESPRPRTSPWALPPFAAPTPEDPPVRGRRPYDAAADLDEPEPRPGDLETTQPRRAIGSLPFEALGERRHGPIGPRPGEPQDQVIWPLGKSPLPPPPAPSGEGDSAGPEGPLPGPERPREVAAVEGLGSSRGADPYAETGRSLGAASDAGSRGAREGALPPGVEPMYPVDPALRSEEATPEGIYPPDPSLRQNRPSDFPPRHHRPYSTPQRPDDDERSERREYPDKLVASGPPREHGIRVRPAIAAEPEFVPEPEFGPGRREKDVPAAVPAVRQASPERIGKPPGGRPLRPDVLATLGPPRGGKHGRRGVRAQRRRPRIGLPLLVVVAVITAAAFGLFVVRWATAPATSGIRLAVGDGQSGDSAFQAPGLPGNGSRQVLTSVASSGSTIVAVGTDTTGAIARPLFIVSANDGKDWTLGEVNGPPGYEAAPGSPGRVVGSGGKWLAVSTDPAGPEGRGMWTSADGRSWAAVDPARLGMFLESDRVTDLARTATGFVAVGSTVQADGTPGAVAWTSADGQAWTRVETPRIGTPDMIRTVKAVVAKGDRVVALAEPGSGTATVILRSDDGGRSWLRTATALPDIRPETGALAASGDGFVLVPTGQRFPGPGVRVHCSPEGQNWTACGTIGPLSPAGSGVRGLSASGAGLAAVVESAWEEYALFTSDDGRDWRKRADLGVIPGTLRGLTITDSGRLVAGGDKRGAGDVENLPVLMTAEKGKAARAVPLESVPGLNRLARHTSGVLAAGGAFVAVGSANGDAGIWTSGNNGANWRAINSQWLGGSGRQALSDVAYGPKGWLAVGSTMADLLVTKPLLVVSSDGKGWRPGPEMSAPEGHYYLAPQTVAAGPKGYVLAGEDQTGAGIGPALWFTADLKKFTRVGELPAGAAEVRIHDVAATDDGFVAIGGTGRSERENGVVWVSADGLKWEARNRVLPDDAQSAGLRHIVARDGRLIATGTALTDDGTRPFSAVSGDGGENWEFAWLPAEAPAVVLDLTASERGIVAVGAHGTGSEVDSSVWASEDGLVWVRHGLVEDGLGGAGAQWLEAVTISGQRVIAVGRSTTSTTDNITIWRSTLSSGDA
ncbi:hypothetical protein [Herbidospora yilanensis]|uniref:hypothetical protein n=1 Tax=Herbidospora yilanensis TaxID=354426 RepID=UPI0012F92231|nr:hypothetical protein [Herbidospora yilanensis]